MGFTVENKESLNVCEWSESCGAERSFKILPVSSLFCQHIVDVNDNYSKIMMFWWLQIQRTSQRRCQLVIMKLSNLSTTCLPECLTFR